MSPLQRCFVQATLVGKDDHEKCKYNKEREIILWDIGKDTLSHDLLKSLCVELCFDEYGIVDTLRRMDKLQSLVVALLAVLITAKKRKKVWFYQPAVSHTHNGIRRPKKVAAPRPTWYKW